MKKKLTYYVVGLMSGTSLDGLDAAYCKLERDEEKWKYEIIKSKNYKYTDDLLERLKRCRNLNSLELDKLDKDLGVFSAQAVNDILKFEDKKADIIASHGHTVFHEPAKDDSLQIGSGKEISKRTGILTINNFREADVKLGGQGAPLVPIGDELLFSDYHGCLNLGGFSNYSQNIEGRRVAWDICPVNVVLNHYAAFYDMDYDRNGAIGREGEVIYALLEYFDSLDFYRRKAPKSLGIEWVDENIFPETDKYLSSFEAKDILRTWYEHSSKIITDNLNGKVLVSGGGAYNDYLMEQIRDKSEAELIIDNNLTETKEALIFALLGVLRLENENNILASVTGAKHDHSAGDIYF